MRSAFSLHHAILALLPALSLANEAARAGRHEWVDFSLGEMPIILTAPHGGRDKPAAIANRTTGNRKGDRNTAELTAAIVEEIRRRTGKTPHVVVSLLDRTKLDPNRDMVDAADGDPAAESTWHRFHACVNRAKESAIGRYGFAFLVDVHGHGHPLPRIELGYALYTAELNQSDAELDNSDAGRRSSLGHLHARSGLPITALLHGRSSLGAFLEKWSYDVIPSPSLPKPGKTDYYSGSYILRHHASVLYPNVDGLQLETPFPGVRDTSENRRKFAKAFVDSLLEFLRTHYRYIGHEQ